MKGYTSEAQVQSIMGISDDVSDSILDIAEAIVDKYTNKNFVADTTVSIRYYNGDNTSDLLVDDCVEISKVEINGDRVLDEGFTEITQYYEYPENEDYINRVSLYSNIFINGRQNQRITAKWGYSEACPDDVGFATAIIAGGVLNYGSNTNNDIKSEKIGNYSVSYNDSKGWISLEKAKNILNQYKEIAI